MSLSTNQRQVNFSKYLHLLSVILPFLLLFSGFLYEITAIQGLNQGRFIYSLDDPYIHLALAYRIAQGHYGINLSEVSAPSSSIIWPFLLAPFAWTTFFEYVPLALNVLIAAATLLVYRQIVVRALREDASPAVLPDIQIQSWASWIIILLLFATNLVGLAVTGMEHSLQVFLCAVIVLGLVAVLQGEPTPAWLAAALIIAPAVRYECLAVVIPALGILLVCRRWKATALILVGVMIPLSAFSLFLHANGLGWLPTSVMAKVNFAGQFYTHTTNPLEHFFYNLSAHQGRILALVMLLMLWMAFYRRAVPFGERALALAGAAAIMAHLAFGQFNWWDRYEIYMVASAALLLIYLGRHLLVAMIRRLSIPLNLALLLGMSLVIGAPYYHTFLYTPYAAVNIYEQQYQMHRFVVDYLRASVAVNDLGWVAYHNPNYVLDLWGLASPQALNSRVTSTSPAWMDEMARRRGVRLVMIYETWFQSHPLNWVPVARLHLGWPQTAAGGDTVTFYTIDEHDSASTRALLRQFAPTLPPGVRLDIIE